MQRKWIVVTGGAGFIGSALVRHLNDLGKRNLILVDNLGSSEKWKNLVGKQFHTLLHKDQLFSWLEGKGKQIEAILHLGACSSTVETNANYLLENNTHYSIRLAQFAFDHQIRFIYASSAATYGDGALGFSDDHALLERYLPLNMYGYSKHLFDLWLKEEGHLDKVVGLKYFNVYGPNEYHKGRMCSAIVKMVPDSLKEGRIRLFKSNAPELFGDGEQKRDFIYVKDVVALTASFLESGECGIFNVGAGEAQTWNRLANAVIRALDRPVRIEYIEMPEDLMRKYQNYTCADMSKATQRGLFKLRYSLEEGVEDYIRNYLLKEATF